MYANTLLLMALGRNHNVSFIKYENMNLSNVKYAEFCDPIEHFSRCTNNDVIIKGCATRNCTQI